MVRRLNKCAYKNKEAYERLLFFKGYGAILLIRKKVDESKKAELLSESSLFYY